MKQDDLCPKCGVVMSRHGSYGQANMACPFRDESELTTDLVGFEGWRVEVIDASDNTSDLLDPRDYTKNDPNAKPRRFYVGRSTGWKPCHLEIHNRRSMGGGPARKSYASVRRLYKR